MKDDRLCVRPILDCTSRIGRHYQDGEEIFRASELIQDTFPRNLQTLAKSTQRISDHLEVLHPEVDWRSSMGFRNILVHGYLGIKLNRIWEIVSVPLPVLSSRMETIQREMNPPE